MKRWFTVGGAALGLVGMAIQIIKADATFSSVPGPFELLIQLVMLAVCIVFGAAVGFAIGWPIDMIRSKKKS